MGGAIGSHVAREAIRHATPSISYAVHYTGRLADSGEVFMESKDEHDGAPVKLVAGRGGLSGAGWCGSVG